MRLQTAPGGYNVIHSDFDQQRLQIMRRKKILQHSSWAQNVGFASTTGRFTENEMLNDVPPSTAYTPKVSLVDSLPKGNARSGAFGSKAARFKDRSEKSSSLTPAQQKEMELNHDIANYLAKHPKEVLAGNLHEGSISRKPQFSSVFAPSHETRLRPVKSPPVPAPGAYDLTPRWDKAKGVIPMVPRAAISKKIPDTSPG